MRTIARTCCFSRTTNWRTASPPKCKAANLGDTVAACVANTGANDKNGYKNSFTDSVSTKPNAQLSNKPSGNATASDAGTGNGRLSKTGADAIAIAVVAVVMLAGAGATIALKRRG